MAESTGIEWTDATWNPVAGCTPISPGCRNCYAARMARRLESMGQAKYAGTAERRGSVDVFTGHINLDPSSLEIPLRWRKPRRIFVNSMSDLFHPDVPFGFVDQVFAVMALTPRHTYQVLTKRPDRMLEYLGIDRHAQAYRDGALLGSIHFDLARDDYAGPLNPLPNVWLGTSCEDQVRADDRIPYLLRCPAAVRFISAEPLLGPIDLCGHIPAYPCWDNGKPHWSRESWQGPFASAVHVHPQLDWVIAGGESGPLARPPHPDWFRSLRDQCVSAHVPFLFKQWGEYAPWIRQSNREVSPVDLIWIDRDGSRYGLEGNDLTAIRRVGKKSAGRLLDGREHMEFPSFEPCTEVA